MQKQEPDNEKQFLVRVKEYIEDVELLAELYVGTKQVGKWEDSNGIEAAYRAFEYLDEYERTKDAGIFPIKIIVAGKEVFFCDKKMRNKRLCLHQLMEKEMPSIQWTQIIVHENTEPKEARERANELYMFWAKIAEEADLKPQKHIYTEFIDNYGFPVPGRTRGTRWVFEISHKLRDSAGKAGQKAIDKQRIKYSGA